jgi:hypothetical protein
MVLEKSTNKYATYVVIDIINTKQCIVESMGQPTIDAERRGLDPVE